MRNENESQTLCKMRKLAQNIFKPYFCLRDTFLANTNFIYELLLLAEKPAINFLMPAISRKKLAWGLLLSSNTKKIKGVQKFRNWSRDLCHQNTCTLCCGLLQNFAMYVFWCNYRPRLSEIARKSPIFRTAVHLTPLLKELGIDAGVERN